MVIESAFLVKSDDYRIKFFDKKETSFIVVIRDLFAGRPPLVNKNKRSSKKTLKRKNERKD